MYGGAFCRDRSTVEVFRPGPSFTREQRIEENFRRDMTTIVRHRESGERHLLVGSGYGLYRSTRPSVLLGSLAPHTTTGEFPVALCADALGSLKWLPTEELLVESVNGSSPSEALRGSPTG